MKSILGIFSRLNPNRAQQPFAGGQRPDREADRSLSPTTPPNALGSIDVKPGEVVDGFRILGELGKGGFGVVYAVQDVETGFIYALKTFRGDLVLNPVVRAMFKKEALTWVSLGDHPFIVPAIRVIDVSGRLGVVMQCIVPGERLGVSLYDYLARTRSPVEQRRLLEWAIQFCYAMEYANGRGVIAHRDIKPQNILLHNGEVLKLSDFGLAAAAQSLRGTNAVGPNRRATGEYGLSVAETDGRGICGTPGYLAPEVFEGSQANVVSDVYSFGIVLWQMVFGRPSPPFKYPMTGDVFRAIYEQQRTANISTPEGELGRVVARCAAAKPTGRFQTFGGLRNELEPLLARIAGTNIVIPTSHGSFSREMDGGNFAALGQHEMAIQCFEQELNRNPLDAKTLNNKGISLRALCRYEALSCYDQSLTVDPYFRRSVGQQRHLSGRTRPVF